MSNLTDLLPAGAGGKQVNFVASGTIGDGVTVALNSDGTVESIATVAQSAGSPVVFEAADSNWVASTFDSVNNKVVIAYSDNANSGYGTAIVGTVSGTSISFGTPVVFQTSLARHISATYDSNSQKIIIAYSDNSTSDRGTAIIGTVSGTSISFGTAAVYNNGFTYYNSAIFDSTNNKVVIAYEDYANNSYGTAIVGTVSGTSISFGSEVVFESANTIWTRATFDSNANKVVIAYKDGGNSNYGTAIVGTVSGTSISFGVAAVFESANTIYIATSFDPNAGKIIVVYRDGGNADSGTAVVGTVSGTGISFGTPVVFNGDSSYYSATYDASAKKIVISYRDDLNVGKYGTVVSATVSGTSISFDTPLVFEAASVIYTSAVFDSNANKVAIAYQDVDNSRYGTSVVFTTGATNSADFIGITDAAISDTASGSVTIKGGISTNVTGLTPNALYYVQDDGALLSGNIPYSISGASPTTAFTISQDSVPTGIAFNTSGSKMFICGRTNSSVFQYSLSSAFDVSTASYDSVSFSFSAQQTTAAGMAFNADGTSMYVLSYGAATVYQYTLSSGFDLTTASYASKSFSVSSQEGEPHGIAFNTSGTKLYIVGVNNDTVYQYSLSSAFDVSTASYDSVSFSIGSQEAIPLGLTFGDSGNKMYVIGTNGDDINEYSLSSAFDISSASFSTSFSVSGEESDPRQMVFSADGTKMFVVGSGSDEVNQYSTTPVSTTVLAGKALSSTSINLDYTT